MKVYLNAAHFTAMECNVKACHVGSTFKNTLKVPTSFPSSTIGQHQERKKTLKVSKFPLNTFVYFYFPRPSIKKPHPEIFKARYFFTSGSFDLFPWLYSHLSFAL